ncbi:Astacin, peptidase M12A family, neutral zinc metallopeptidase, Zn-binding site [Phytophthora palmivora]|uniref:Astacin, peptidase M12A family, neutral zinc metallopeptidase, Zn-binding site n=1 Tax=Phytophthora palmivora TaxID=4796 RepID=A0A2P4XMK2_9STRA|nr:Astacin, peptidase M12A family, neutral zinc metallopeptidase, Zn-binding site [Phytophthora palmivora]
MILKTQSEICNYSEIETLAVLSAGDIYTLRALYGSKDNAKVSDVKIPTVASSSTGSVGAPDSISDMIRHTMKPSTAKTTEERSSTEQTTLETKSTASEYKPGNVHGEGSSAELLEWWENLDNTVQIQKKRSATPSTRSLASESP